MLIINKYDNPCKLCGQTIPIDTQVELDKSSGIRHIKCPTTEDKFKDIVELPYKESRELTNCQLCESEANYVDRFYYEGYRLCERCWEENMNGDM